MDIQTLAELSLPDSAGRPQRLGDLWVERPAVLVFARHFGWLHCREHVAQLRDRHDEILGRGARCVAIGTGDQRYARDLAERERIPFPILVDDDGAAARAAAVERVGLLRLFTPASFPGTLGALRRGYFVGRPGRRVDQLGATFVVTPGDRVVYRHHDAHPADHAPLEDVLAAVARG